MFFSFDVLLLFELKFGLNSSLLTNRDIVTIFIALEFVLQSSISFPALTIFAFILIALSLLVSFLVQLGLILNLADSSRLPGRKSQQAFLIGLKNFFKYLGNLLVVRSGLQIMLGDLELQAQSELGFDF